MKYVHFAGRYMLACIAIGLLARIAPIGDDDRALALIATIAAGICAFLPENRK